MHLRSTTDLFSWRVRRRLVLAVGVYIAALDHLRVLRPETMSERRPRSNAVAVAAAPRGLAAGRRRRRARRLRRPGHRPQGGGRRASRSSPAGRSAFWSAGCRPAVAGLRLAVHDIGEEYLYSAHMVQHLLLTFVVPPLFLLATPTWLARLVVGDGRRSSRAPPPGPPGGGRRAVQRVVVAHPLAGPGERRRSRRRRSTTWSTCWWSRPPLLMWMPVCGPLPELRLSLPAQMIYLFLMSIIPTVPAAWLTFAEGAGLHGLRPAPPAVGHRRCRPTSRPPG